MCWAAHRPHNHRPFTVLHATRYRLVTMAPQLRCRKFMRNSLLSRRQMVRPVGPRFVRRVVGAGPQGIAAVAWPLWLLWLRRALLCVVELSARLMWVLWATPTDPTVVCDAVFPPPRAGCCRWLLPSRLST